MIFQIKSNETFSFYFHVESLCAVYFSFLEKNIFYSNPLNSGAAPAHPSTVSCLVPISGGYRDWIFDFDMSAES